MQGFILAEGPEQTHRFRLRTLRMGLQAELQGMRLTRGRSCYSIIKKEFGLKGNKEKVLREFTKLIGEV